MNQKPILYLVRHGTSRANEEGIIVSDVINGVAHYGLSNAGKEQVLNSALHQLMYNPDFVHPQDIHIINSPFKRAVETASIISGVLRIPHTNQRISTLCRERFFGAFELASDSHYQTVWDHDEKNEHHTSFGVESVSSVFRRGVELINTILADERYVGKKVIIVSHGDFLQITLCHFLQKSPSRHRTHVDRFQTAEFRKITLV